MLSRCSRCASRLLPAALFLEKSQIPQNPGRNGRYRPFGPFGIGKVQSSPATFGLSRLATAYALGGFMIIEPCPEIRYLLFDASSQANTSAGRNFTSLCMYSSTRLTASDLTVILP